MSGPEAFLSGPESAFPVPGDLDWGGSEVHCHDRDWRPAFSPPGKDRWERRTASRSCSYCGSVHFEALYEFLRDNPYQPNPVYDRQPVNVLNRETFAAWKVGQEERMRAYRGVEVADWKYGWPHKIYLQGASPHMIKFYNTHLNDLAGHSGFEPLTELIARHTAIEFSVDETAGLGYRRAVRPHGHLWKPPEENATVT